MSMILTQTQTVIQEANDSVVNFISRFQVGNTLRKCRAHKTKGFSVIEIFRYLLSCMFSQSSTYMSMRIGTYKEALMIFFVKKRKKGIKNPLNGISFRGW